jgi:hypothetical protein
MEWRYWADAILAVCLIPILLIAITVLYVPFRLMQFVVR